MVVLVCVKRKKKALHYTSNVAYACHDGQCTEEDIDNYSICRPQAILSVTNQNSTQDQVSAVQYCNMIKDNAIDLEAQQSCKGLSANNMNMNIVENVAYIVKPGEIPLSSNVAYESHVHQSTDNQNEYDYI